MRRRLSLGYLVCGLVLSAGYLLLGAPQVLYQVIGASAPIVIVVAVLAFRPPHRGVWLLLAAGQSLLVAGDVVWSVLAQSYGGVAPFPSTVDAIYFAGYVLLIASLVALTRGTLRFQRTEAVLDAIVFSIGCGLLLWRWLFAPLLEASGSGLAGAVAVTYPLFDFLLLGLLIRTARRGRPLPAELFLIGGFVILAISDIGYVQASLLGTYEPRQFVDLGWLIAYVFWGAAALHPSAHQSFERDDRWLEPLASRRIGVLVAACLLMPIGLLGVAHLQSALQPIALVMIAAFLLALFARLALLINELRGLASAAAEAERRFRAVFDGARTGISIGRQDGTITTANPALARMLGYEPDELEGTHFRDLTPESEHVEADEDLLEELHAGNGDGYRLEKKYQRKDGSTFWGSLQVSAAEIEGETGVIAIVENLTELNDLQGRLRQSQKLEAVGRFAGGLAHDFNNVLTAISGFASLGLGRTVDPALRHTMRQIVEAAERGSGLTSQLLSFSRGRVISAARLDVNVSVAAMAPMLEQLLPVGMTLKLRLADAPAWILADERQLVQVLMNLVTNAGDASPPDGVVTVVTDAAGDDVRLTVSDEGHGMDEQTRLQAFEPFFTTKVVGAGTGLGLATVYGIVMQFGGQVALESAPGAGTKAIVVLPVAEPAVRAAVVPVRAAGGGPFVLVAEDDAAVADVVGMLLAEAGYRVELCASGEEALAFAEAGLAEVDVLLTDIQMPGIDGFELAASLLARRADLPIVFMSGFAETGSEHAELRHGRPWLQKPFDPDELEGVVAKALAGDCVAA